MSTVRIYKSTDPGAPPHPSSTRGSMAALLRACLVTGWTSGDFTAAPAGWEEPFAETNGYACFRAIQGVARQFYQIDDATTNANVAYIRSYESMSSAESGMEQRGGTYFGKWYSSSAYSSWWAVIADERTCYVILDGADASLIHGFGEYTSLIDGDPTPSFIAGHGDVNNLANDDTNMPLHTARALVDTTRHAGYLHHSLSNPLAASSFSVLNMGVNSGEGISRWENFVSVAPSGVHWLYAPLIIKAIDDVSVGPRIPCGVLRGIHAPLTRPEADRSSFPVGDKTFFFILSDSGLYNIGSVAFDITGSWD